MATRVIKRAVRFAFADGGSVKARVLRSGIWVGFSEIAAAVLNSGRSIILARMLTPEVFGLMGLASIALRTMETFTRPGIAQALLVRKQEFEEAKATAFTLLVGRGFLLALALASAAPWVARFYEAKELEPMLKVLSLVFVIGSFNNIDTIARWRVIDYRQLTYVSQAANLLGTIVTVSLVYWLRSVWALVIGQVVLASLTTLLSYWFLGGRVRFAFQWTIARELMAYGKFITGSSIVLFVASELDSTVIGKLLGTQQLGYYAFAFTLVTMITVSPSRIASSILLPAYSKMQSDGPALRKSYLRVLSLFMLLVLPATAGLVLLAKPLILVVYGRQWLPAVVPLQVLAAFGVFRALYAFSGYLFEGIGMPKVAFHLGLLRLAIVAAFIVPMVRAFGLLGAAVTITVGGLGQWLATLMYLRKLVGIRRSQVVASLWRPIWSTALMGLAVASLQWLVEVKTLLSLLMVVLLGVVVYATLNYRLLLDLRRERL